MSRQIGEYDGVPIVTVDKIGKTHMFINDCPLCGETHKHGSEPQLTKFTLSHRVSHCDSTGGYFLCVTDNTERPPQ